MEKEVLREVLKGCNYHEKIMIKMFKKVAIKVYKKGVKKGFYLAS